MDPHPTDCSGHEPPDTLLLIGHPGHELRVVHWIERTRPLVAVITDGSGRRGPGRLASTLRVLETAGARPLEGCVGMCSDRRSYEAMLARDADLFWGLLLRVEAAMGTRPLGTIASDALEHFNPTHDVCCLMAAALAERWSSRGRPVGHVTFPLDAHPMAHADTRAIDLVLDEVALDRKVAAARGYQELRGEVESALRIFGREPFGRECLSRASDPFAAVEQAIVPYYERVGRERQASGTYTEVITLPEHIRPLARALRARLSAEAGVGMLSSSCHAHGTPVA